MLARLGPGLSLGRQHDAHEFFTALLDTVEKEVLAATRAMREALLASTRPDERMLEGIPLCPAMVTRTVSSLTCPECGHVSKTLGTTDMLPVGVGPGGLQSLLSGTAKPEQLDDENKWHCSGCKRAVRASRQTVLAWPPPAVLGIHLKRFDFRVAKPQGDASRPLPSPGGLLRPTGGILGWALGGMSSYGGGYGAVGGQKLNDHVEYPARIRLDETLLPRAPASSSLAPLGIDHTSIVPLARRPMLPPWLRAAGMLAGSWSRTAAGRRYD